MDKHLTKNLLITGLASNRLHYKFVWITIFFFPVIFKIRLLGKKKKKLKIS